MRWLKAWYRLFGQPGETGRPAAPQSGTVAPISTADAFDPKTSVHCSGKVVNDFDVAYEYPDFAMRDYKAVEATDGSIGTMPMVSFRVENALVTQAYIVVDPTRGLLFLNQTYWGIQHIRPKTAPYVCDETFDLRCESMTPIKGRTAVIGGPFDGNYYHWMLSWCPRLILLKTLAPEIYHDPNVKLLIDVRAKSEPFASFLRALAISPERIIWADCETTDYQLEEAILVSLPHEHKYYPELQAALAAEIRAGVALPTARGRRRIWISRQQLPAPRRRVANMEAVSPVLAKYGFEDLTLENLPLAQQVAAFEQAEIILGVHGAGFVNMIFCPKDCRVVAIEKEFSIRYKIDRFVTTLAQSCDLDHEALVANPSIDPDTDRSQFGVIHNEDVEVDPVALASLIERTGIGPVATLPDRLEKDRAGTQAS